MAMLILCYVTLSYLCCHFVSSFSLVSVVFFFKQKTAYEMRISDWSSDVCSSDLAAMLGGLERDGFAQRGDAALLHLGDGESCVGTADIDRNDLHSVISSGS